MTQIWPTETFAVRNPGTSPEESWDYPDRYIATMMLDYSSGSITLPTGSKTFRGRPGILYSHGRTSASVYEPGDPGVAAFQRHLGQEDGTRLMSCVERDFWAQDCEVSASFAMHAAGDTSQYALDGYFIFARVRDGDSSTVAAIFGSDTDSARRYIHEPDGIFFGHVQRSGGADYFVVGTMSGGVATVIDSVSVADSGAVSSSFSHGSQPFRHFKPGTLRMVVEGTRVRCYANVGDPFTLPYANVPYSQHGTYTGWSLATPEVEIFDETNAAFTATEGRAGLGAQSFVDGTSYTSYITVDWFQINELGNPTPYMRDEFRRNWVRSSYEVPEHSSFSNEQPGGFTLMQAWTGDGMGGGQGQGQSGSLLDVHYGHLKGDYTNDRVGLGHDIDADTLYSAAVENQNYGWYISQNPTSEINQRYKATFEIDNATDYEVGVALRYTPTNVASAGNAPILRSRLLASSSDPQGVVVDFPHTCYLAVVENVGSSFEAKILRFAADVTTGNEATEVATATISDPGSSFEIDFQAVNLDQAGQQFVALQMQIDGVVQTLTAGSGGDFDFAGGWAYDLSTLYSVTGGSSVGFFFEIKDSTWADDSVYVLSFEADDPDAPDPPDSSDQPSVGLPAESAGTSGELTTDLSWEIKEEDCVGQRSFRTQAGFRVGGPTLSRIRPKWSCVGRSLPHVDTDSFFDFWDSHYPTGVPFEWTRQDTGVTTVVRFVGGSVPRRQRHTAGGVGAEEVRFTLEEVFDDRYYNELTPPGGEEDLGEIWGFCPNTISGPADPFDHASVYDPTTNTWTNTSQFLSAAGDLLRGCSSSQISGGVLLSGGARDLNSNGTLNLATLLADPSTETAAVKQQVIQPHNESSAATLSGSYCYVGGAQSGTTGSHRDEIWRFDNDAGAGAWTQGSADAPDDCIYHAFLTAASDSVAYMMPHYDPASGVYRQDVYECTESAGSYSWVTSGSVSILARYVNAPAVYLDDADVIYKIFGNVSTTVSDAIVRYDYVLDTTVIDSPSSSIQEVKHAGAARVDLGGEKIIFYGGEVSGSGSAQTACYEILPGDPTNTYTERSSSDRSTDMDQCTEAL